MFGRDPLFGMITPFVINIDNDSNSVDEISSCPLTIFEQNRSMVIPKEVILVLFSDFGRFGMKVDIPRDSGFLFFACIKFEHLLVILVGISLFRCCEWYFQYD